MKKPGEFIKTLHLGDRACKQVTIDGWGKRLVITVDSISRIRNPSGEWGFYNDENIDDGLIVFEGLTSFQFSPQCFVPSDWIEILSIDETCGETDFKAILSLGAVDDQGNSKEVTLTVWAKSLHIEDPKRPGVKITE
jgi:hypothetical protein